jgi:hypothetical protein
LFHTFSCHCSPPTILPFSLTSSCHLFLGPLLYLVVSKSIDNTFLEILFSCILCLYPNHCKLSNHIVSVIVGLLTVAWISLLINILQFSFSLSYSGPRTFVYTFLSKMFNCFLSVFVSVEVSDAYVNVLSIIVFFSINFNFLDVFICSIKYVLLAFVILSCKCIL